MNNHRSAKQMILSLPGIRNRKNRQVIKWYLRAIRRMVRPNEDAAMLNQARIYQRTGFETFVGYYDVCPMSPDQTKLLAHTVRGGPVSARAGGIAHLGFFDVASHSFHEIGTTTSWCWQMGSRLRWFPKREDSQILFNALDADRHGASVYDLSTKSVVRKYPFAFIDVAKNGGYAISLNFSRLGRLRPGYGYIDLPDITMGQPAPADDGLWRVELESGANTLLVTFSDLLRLNHNESMEAAQHYINLVMISPTGANIVFLHLWVGLNGSSHVRLMGMNQWGEGLKVLADDAKPSHGWWLDDQRYLVTMVFPSGRTEYRLIDNGVTCGMLDENLPCRDGHPSLSPDEKYLLTDSYPDEFGEQNLEVFSMHRRHLTTLGKYTVGLPYVDDELRCDLHPRWSPRGDHVVFDSTHGGARAIYVLDFRVPGENGLLDAAANNNSK